MLRAAYARTFETPFNENLILSSGTGGGGLAENVFGSQSAPIQPGQRNQFNTGFQQGIGRWFIVDADYFWKYTHNAYDFSVLFNTPITFPIAWHNSKLDGVTARVSTINLHGFQAYMTLGHTRARYFPPEIGGLIPLGGFAGSVFRIDHDQAYQQTAVFRYQRPKNARVDRLHLALRQRPGGERRAGCGGGAGADGGAAGGHRFLLRRRVRDLRQPDHGLRRRWEHRSC